jgi:hypothetical protein
MHIHIIIIIIIIIIYAAEVQDFEELAQLCPGSYN